MLKMYGFWRSAASFRVRIALNLKGFAYEETMVDLDAGEQHAPAFRAINPAGAVPALYVDGGPPLTQSLAILEYLDEVYPDPPLLPADPRGKARVRSLALIFAADHHPLIVPRVRRYLTEELGLSDEQRAGTGSARGWCRPKPRWRATRRPAASATAMRRPSPTSACSAR
jgi:maleylacetoacetate isomerase